MEKLVSKWYKDESLPENYIFPPETRPGKSIVPLCNTIPVIDLSQALGHNRSDTIQQILKASKEFGFFQVHASFSHKFLEVILLFFFYKNDFLINLFHSGNQITNHGVPEKLINETMSVFKEFFEMPAEYQASLYSEDPSKSCRLCTSSVNYNREEIHYWRDKLSHPCHPLDECLQQWPERPTRYR